MTQEHNVPEALSEEICRRAARLDELSNDPTSSASARDHVRGELIGLRGALGIALGHKVSGGAADEAGIDYYRGWPARQHPAAGSH